MSVASAPLLEDASNRLLCHAASSSGCWLHLADSNIAQMIANLELEYGVLDLQNTYTSALQARAELFGQIAADRSVVREETFHYKQRDRAIKGHDSKIDGLKRKLEAKKSDVGKQVLKRASLRSWRPALVATMLLWGGTWLLTPGVAAAAASCDEHTLGIATLSGCSLLGVCSGLAIPIFAVKYVEKTIHSRLFPIEIYILGPYKLHSHKLPLSVYCCGLTMLTLVSDLDLATTGIFLGRLLRTHVCSESVFEDVYSEHIVSGALPSLLLVCSIVWGAMLLQLVWALAFGLPIKMKIRPHGQWQAWQQISGQCATINRYWAVDGEEEDVWQADTLGSNDVPNYELLQPLLIASRMQATTMRYLEFMDALINQHAFDILSNALRMRRYAVERFLRLFFETSLFLLVQALGEAVQATITHRTDWLSVLSLATTATMMLHNAVEMTSNLLRTRRILKPYFQRMEEHPERKTNIGGVMRSHLDILAHARSAVTTAISITVAFWVATLITFYAAACLL